MERNRSKIINFLITTCLCLSACERNNAGAEYIRGNRVEYEFVLSDVDTLSYYNIGFYTNPKFGSTSGVELEIRWYSPSNDIYMEKVWLKCSRSLQPYRDYMRFIEKGDWILRIYPSIGKENLSGLGMEWKKDGTR